MKKIILSTLGLFLALSLISCKKSDSKNSSFQDKTKTESEQRKIDFDWSKMNYNMLSSLVFDVQINSEKYMNKRVKVSGNYYTAVYEGKRYHSVLIWDPTGCCPAGFDFFPPADMKFPEDFPEPDEKITVTGLLKFSDDSGQKMFIFQAEDITKE